MRFFRPLLYALILIVVGLASALTAMRFAIHVREVAVPKLVGLTTAEAQRAAADAGLSIWEDQRFYSNEVPEGRIVSQLPLPGTRVRAGFRVRTAESLGPQKVDIPNLLGQSVRSAELNLKDRGLELGEVAHLPTANAAPDQVIAQDPTPDSQQLSTPAVNVLVSDAPAAEVFVMPDFVGSKLSEAKAAIQSAGLEVGAISTAPAGATSTDSSTKATVVSVKKGTSSRSSDAIIVRQTPAAGQRVTKGTTVQFQVELTGGSARNGTPAPKP